MGFIREVKTEELLKAERKEKKKSEKRGLAIITPLLSNPIDNRLLQMR